MRQHGYHFRDPYLVPYDPYGYGDPLMFKESAPYDSRAAGDPVEQSVPMLYNELKRTEDALKSAEQELSTQLNAKIRAGQGRLAKIRKELASVRQQRQLAGLGMAGLQLPNMRTLTIAFIAGVAAYYFSDWMGLDRSTSVLIGIGIAVALAIYLYWRRRDS